MKRRYYIFFKSSNAVRPFFVWDIETEKTVGTFSTLGKAKAKYPKADDYWVNKINWD